MRASAWVFTPAPPHGYILLRVGLAATLLIRCWVERKLLLDLYGNRGLIPWALSEIRPIGWLPNMTWLSRLLQPYGITEDGTVYVVFLLYTAGLLGLLLGVNTRAAAIVAWLGHLTLFESASFSSYGVDSFINIGLFYCVLMPPTATPSVARLLAGPRHARTIAAGLLLRTLQVHVCIIYFTAGLAKARGHQWWTGEAIWRAVIQPQFHTHDMWWLASFPILAALAAWSTLLVEVGYCFFIWPRRTRTLWLAATIVMHLFIGFVLGLRFFAAVLIVLNLAAFGSEALADGERVAVRMLQQFKRQVLAPRLSSAV